MKILKLILKDLRSVFTDPKIVAILVIMPMVLTSILGLALSGVFSNEYTVHPFNIAIVKQYDNHNFKSRFEDTISQSFLGAGISEDDIKAMSKGIADIDIEAVFFEEFFGSEEIKEMVHYDIVGFNTAMRGLEKDTYSAAIVLPENFLMDSYINMLTPFRNEIEIQVFKNPNNRMTASITEDLMKAYSDTFSSLTISKNVLVQQFAKYDMLDQGMQQMDDFMEAFSMNENNMDIEIVPIEGKKTIGSMSYYAISMMTLFLLFSAAQGSTLLLDEKKSYTLQRMMVAGYKHYQIVMGKYIVVFAIAVLQMMSMMIYSRIAFNVVWGNLSSVLVVVILSAFAIAGLGTLFSVITLKMGNYSLA
ncbi:MAG: ABC transporter permease, partial [Clostridia bacterium]|nr:ABC transporter permease [Clostridia bacterium]